MSTSAVIFMIISMMLIWGGLILAILHLRKHPDIEMHHLDNEPEFEINNE